MKTRNASFELLRIICMFMIVFYHIFDKAFGTIVENSASYRTLLIPMHIPVVCFVLISGYFGIKFSFRKVISFFAQILFYNVLLYVLCSIITESFTINELLLSFLPLAHNQDLWFIRTYMILLLITPIINKYIETTPPNQFKIMCAILAFITIYLGIKSDDPSLNGGKNVVNFIFIYFLGHGIREKIFFPNFSLSFWMIMYFAFNIILCSIYYLSFGHGLSNTIYHWGWGYNSPLLIINAMLFFMIFVNLKINSAKITKIAKSVFAIYLIHSNLHVQNILWPLVLKTSIVKNLLLSNILITIVILFICIVLDKILSPFYNGAVDLILKHRKE